MPSSVSTAQPDGILPAITVVHWRSCACRRCGREPRSRSRAEVVLCYTCMSLECMSLECMSRTRAAHTVTCRWTGTGSKTGRNSTEFTPFCSSNCTRPSNEAHTGRPDQQHFHVCVCVCVFVLVYMYVQNCTVQCNLQFGHGEHALQRSVSISIAIARNMCTQI